MLICLLQWIWSWYRDWENSRGSIFQDGWAAHSEQPCGKGEAPAQEKTTPSPGWFEREWAIIWISVIFDDCCRLSARNQRFFSSSLKQTHKGYAKLTKCLLIPASKCSDVLYKILPTFAQCILLVLNIYFSIQCHGNVL